MWPCCIQSLANEDHELKKIKSQTNHTALSTAGLLFSLFFFPNRFAVVFPFNMVRWTKKRVIKAHAQFFLSEHEPNANGAVSLLGDVRNKSSQFKSLRALGRNYLWGTLQINTIITETVRPSLSNQVHFLYLLSLQKPKVKSRNSLFFEKRDFIKKYLRKFDRLRPKSSFQATERSCQDIYFDWFLFLRFINLCECYLKPESVFFYFKYLLYR